MISAAAYAERLRPLLDSVACQSEALDQAADLIAEALRGDGVLQAFGAGHSEVVAMELTGRAGGLVPVNRLSVRDVAIHGDAPLSALADPKLERDPSIAHQIYALAAPSPSDVFVVASQSGIHGSVVELALLVKERGHSLIAITSVEHTTRVAASHPSGLRLSEIADVVLDNGAPYGDALLPLQGGGLVCAASTVTSALLAQLLTAEIVRRFQAVGEVPPVYLSASVPGGDAYNHTLESRYAGRLRRTA
ncbi:putative phosphosugar-binding protein [Allocatelliglobosispora scoriae]|uniref:Putative phosphosugar-binding protein n=1 Tax=Allocatelliglobosispora scoriae TaxID=643052 RepID=A0A841BPF3_9ACTN|nr:SIS domain-containing protein [Allocatelliglobosispora scoriae]MBB5869186.1 putative phosphosugar-binding protein [Allocatelliglobosispora scoriae]